MSRRMEIADRLKYKLLAYSSIKQLSVKNHIALFIA